MQSRLESLTHSPESLKFLISMSSEPPSHKKPVITLDGLSGSGKSTLARLLAKQLCWAYLDSGAWYRALTWAVIREQENPAYPEAVLQVLSCRPDGNVLVDGAVVDADLRTPEIDQAVSILADHSSVRDALNERMRELRSSASIQGVVADGRDAGAVIFPDASLKVFVDAPVEIRAQRRFAQQQTAGLEVDFDRTLAALKDRDSHDSARGEAAPKIHSGDRVLDNESITVEEAIRRLLSWANAISVA